MSNEEIRERAKVQIRFYSSQQENLKRQFKAGNLEKEKWLALHKEYIIRKEAIQSIFK